MEEKQGETDSHSILYKSLLGVMIIPISSDTGCHKKITEGSLKFEHVFSLNACFYSKMNNLASALYLHVLV